MAAEQTPEEIASLLQEFLTTHPKAVVLEDGRIAFDLQTAQYTVQQQPGRCTLQLWSDTRNLSRRVLAVAQRRDTLKLSTLRLGQSKPQTLEIVAQPERRAPSAREGTRQRFLPVLQRMLQREFPDWTIDPLQSAMDLERSFGPAYARGTLHKGQKAWAAVGVNAEESQSTVDGILTIGILWLQVCRERAAGKRLFQGLVLFVPGGTATVTLSRIGWLRSDAAQWRLFEFSPRTEDLEERDAADVGNLSTHLVHLPDEGAARERFASPLAVVMELLPPAAQAEVEQRLRSSSELALLLYGLEFARIRIRAAARTFTSDAEISIGAGANETVLTPATEPQLRAFLQELFERRHPTGSPRDPLFRAAPEAWLESVLRQNIGPLAAGQGSFAQFDPEHVYPQVPAFQAGDRGMLDLLSVTRDGRLAVLELKANEDLHFALQGLDYWIRVRWHHVQAIDPQTGLGMLQRHGYFRGVRLAPEPPRLFLVAPSLRIHPATEQVLRFFKREVEWTLLGLHEQWRRTLKVITRFRST
ncbi:hypothetical protein [Terriglobus sp.]|uniref:hypothetical protein n=1 Tax=Terriglobus sp. TaxID=1889013 RepID=UPI003B00C98E